MIVLAFMLAAIQQQHQQLPFRPRTIDAGGAPSSGVTQEVL